MSTAQNRESGRARWIWYRGDFEIYHNLILHARREERGHVRPSFWNMAVPYPRVDFYTEFAPETDTMICVRSNADGRVVIDGSYHTSYALNTPITISKGPHTVLVETIKNFGLPAIYIDSEYLITDRHWMVNNGTAKQLHAGDTPGYFDEQVTPEDFVFSYERVDYVSKQEIEGTTLYDFGKELFAKLVIRGVSPDNALTVCYGESPEEALDIENAILWEKVSGEDHYCLRPRALRYVHITQTKPEPIEIYADYEYLPITDIGSFSCDEPLVNQIWEMCAYTFHLNSREFFLDGIKRDRWVWSGDAYQSFMIDQCLYFDTEIIKRTITALVGKPPFEQHINTINDYTLYMIIALYDYYFSTGDLEFVRFIFERVQGLYDFTVSRLDENGFMCERPGDWIFIDWSPMDKSGPLCAEQILLWKAHRSMQQLSEVLGLDGSIYAARADDLYDKIYRYFWKEELGAFIDGYTSGQNNVTRHANIFAILYDFVDADKQALIVRHVLDNEAITPITTPYFNLFQLMVRCKLGDVDYMQREMESYWGGMIRLGATTIWEEYDPAKSGTEHYDMYGHRFEKSLCHAWGAGPILLLSKYCLGVSATDIAYAAFEIHPNPGRYGHMKGAVPLYGGQVDVELDGDTLTVRATVEGGYITHRAGRIPVPANETVVVEHYRY